MLEIEHNLSLGTGFSVFSQRGTFKHKEALTAWVGCAVQNLCQAPGCCKYGSMQPVQVVVVKGRKRWVYAASEGQVKVRGKAKADRSLHSLYRWLASDVITICWPSSVPILVCQCLIILRRDRLSSGECNHALASGRTPSIREAESVGSTHNFPISSVLVPSSTARSP